MREYTRRPEEKPFPVSCLAGSKLDRPAQLFAADVCKKIDYSTRKLLTENQMCSRRIMNCPSFYMQSKYGRMTQFLSEQNCSNQRKFAHTKEKLLTKIRFAQKICSQQKFARSIEKLLTMKNLAGSDGSTRWLNVLHQANRSTAGAHHSTVSVVTAGTCWAGPSCYVIGRVQLYSRT